ncbi:hypothetical protein KY332_03230 [Candidatus Woesearchaeota archaeon]|nr:hypothetical protein [Candidatus Woesearchaeota archaeon]
MVETEQESIEQSKQTIMPTHVDLIESKKKRINLLKLSKYAVYVKKISSKKKEEILDKSQIKLNQDTIQALCEDFKNYEFLIDFQYAENTVLTDENLDFIEKVQQINELKNICMIEKSPYQTASDFESQLRDWIKRNPEKNIIPVSESHTSEKIKKIGIAKSLGIKNYGIKFRGYKRNKSNLSKFLANLKLAELQSLVFGVFPTKWKSTKATMLLPPLFFGSNFVSSWIAWGGGKTNLMLVCNDWKYRLHTKSTRGLAAYDGKDRISFLSKSTTTAFNTAFQKIDTINQVSLMLRKGIKLTKIQMKTLFK